MASRLAEYLDKNTLKDKLSITYAAAGEDTRQFKVTFDGVTMDATLVDLPTIIESQKSVDKRNFYKTADICQMLVCTSEDPEKKNVQVIYPHGLSAPLKNVRKKRFRKSAASKLTNSWEVQTAVARLLRDNMLASSDTYELVDVTEETAPAGDEDVELVSDDEAEANAVGSDSEEEEEESDDEDVEDREEEDVEADKEIMEDEASECGFKDNTASSSGQRIDVDEEGAGDQDSSSDSDSDSSSSDSSSSSDDESSTQVASSTQSTASAPAPPSSSSSAPQPMQIEVTETPEQAAERQSRAAAIEAATAEVTRLETRVAEVRKQLAATNNPLLSARVRASLRQAEEELNSKTQALESLKAASQP
ncbi:hypothetical protein CAOG_001479 [Capsaspora owczarzaki ATCC 30864]|uniref:TAFII55 protein conserved region domain-containing protein n=1 Tax=Capsaspora owczarzaki (strain ATCC 30864) TaxID=595528 RepID=A0A0D2WJE2_CAPO3|nr:hypothetical protein CAOG_001479 [Capsaspora owczarzaki ATCC 30864]